jgi:hypothetical protein
LATFRERDIHQGGVIGDGKGCGSGEEERKSERRIAPKQNGKAKSGSHEEGKDFSYFIHHLFDRLFCFQSAF